MLLCVEAKTQLGEQMFATRSRKRAAQSELDVITCFSLVCEIQGKNALIVIN